MYYSPCKNRTLAHLRRCAGIVASMESMCRNTSAKEIAIKRIPMMVVTCMPTSVHVLFVDNDPWKMLNQNSMKIKSFPLNLLNPLSNTILKEEV